MEATTGHLQEIVVMLSAAVCIVACLGTLRISPVLGYLAAGIAIGPFGFGFVHPNANTATLAEFGVIFLLFVIGLELSVERLRRLRRQVFGFGTAQMLITAFAIGFVAYGVGLSPQAAVIVGGGLALSSTAIVLQVLADQGLKSSQVGRLSLATLILQDLMVIPLLVMVQVFASQEETLGLALSRAAVQAVVAIVCIVIIGRLFLRPLFRFISSIGNDELLTATILLIVLATAWASHMAGLSPALGAFIAGLLVAETEFRPQVEADILPFKSLLLGLFFMVVGMSLDFALLLAEFWVILLLAGALLLGKALLIIMLARAFGFPMSNAVHVGMLLSQGGEFAFVLFGLAGQTGVLSVEASQMLLVAVTLTMGVTPLLAYAGESLSRALSRRTPGVVHRMMEETRDLSEHVIISGFGRVGTAVARLLEAERISYVGLDITADLVSSARARGMPVHFGDASRRLVLKAVGLERARAVIITHADTRISTRSILAVRQLNPDLPIIVRARTYSEVRSLEEIGANLAVAEMFETSLQLGGALMRELGVPDYEIARVMESFRSEDYARMREEEK